MLTGNEILKEIEKGRITIDPFDPNKINPNSVNLTLNNKLLVYKELVLDMHKKNETKELIIPESGFLLMPGDLYLGTSNEMTATDYFIPMINGRSSGGRLGLTIHVCAGFGDVGFKGKWTLEITVVQPLKIYPNDEIAQICFFRPDGDIGKLYRGKYYNQEDVTASRFFTEVNEK